MALHRDISDADDSLSAGAVTTAALATGAVTGPKIAAAAFATYVVAAGNGAGARTMTGALVGDKVICAFNGTDVSNAAGSFETVVTVADQLQQSGTDLTGDSILVITIRG